MKRIKHITLICMGATALLSSLSAEAAMPLPQGWYLEGNVGEPNVSDINYGNNVSNSISGLGWNVNVGYKFIPFFGMEFGYTNYGNTNVEYNSTKVGKATSQSYNLVGKAMLPIQNSGFEFMAKLGVGLSKTHVVNNNPSYVSANDVDLDAGTFNSTAFVYGVGGEYSFTPSMAVNAQWVRSDGGSETGNLDLYSLGFAYLFG